MEEIDEFLDQVPGDNYQVVLVEISKKYVSGASYQTRTLRKSELPKDAVYCRTTVFEEDHDKVVGPGTEVYQTKEVAEQNDG